MVLEAYKKRLAIDRHKIGDSVPKNYYKCHEIISSNSK